MKVAIIGLPQSGKTTVFNAITGAHGDVSGHHVAEQVSAGVVKVPDERLDILAKMLAPDETIPATIEFEDIGGVFAHLTGGEQSGRAVAALREVDAILMVLRGFESGYVPEVLGGVNPLREYEAMSGELLLADLAVIEKRLEGIALDIRRGRPGRDVLLQEQAVLERCREAVEQGKRVQGLRLSEVEMQLIKNYGFLTIKPRLCVLNIGEDNIAAPPRIPELDRLEPAPIRMCAELEMELMDLQPAERAAFMADAGLKEMASGRIIRACYDLLGLRSFFTHVSDKLRAWTIEAGASAKGAAGRIHTDMEKGFIRAEVVSFDDLSACGSLKEAKARGKVRMEGKDYVVQDGDIVTFHFSR